MATTPIDLRAPDPAPARGPRPSTRVEPAPIRWLRRWGFRWLHLFDAIFLYAAMVVITLVRFGTTWPTYPRNHYFVGFAIATGIHLLVLYFGGAYDRELRLGLRPWLPRIAKLTFLAVLLDAAAALLAERYLMPRGNLVILLMVATLGLTGNRWISRRLRARRYGPAKALLVGAPDDLGLARKHLAEADASAIIVGERPDARDLAAAVDATAASDVLLLGHRMVDDIYPEPLAMLEERSIGVLQRVGAQEALLGLQAVRQIGGVPFVPLRTHALSPSRARFKRVEELIILLLTAPLTIPLGLLTALYVRIVAGKGIFFRQARVGQAGVPFQMLKFRTMREPEPGEHIDGELAGTEHPRIIPACRWLRTTRLDELPQLLHVARGTMSLVGPRPEVPELTAQFERLVPGYGRRHEIPPGITGLAQVQGRYHTDPSYKLGHDIQYLVNWSPVLDLEILGLTAWVILARRV